MRIRGAVRRRCSRYTDEWPLLWRPAAVLRLASKISQETVAALEALLLGFPTLSEHAPDREEQGEADDERDSASSSDACNGRPGKECQALSRMLGRCLYTHLLCADASVLASELVLGIGMREIVDELVDD